MCNRVSSLRSSSNRPCGIGQVALGGGLSVLTRQVVSVMDQEIVSRSEYIVYSILSLASTAAQGLILKSRAKILTVQYNMCPALQLPLMRGLLHIYVQKSGNINVHVKVSGGWYTPRSGEVFPLHVKYTCIMYILYK